MVPLEFVASAKKTTSVILSTLLWLLWSCSYETVHVNIWMGNVINQLSWRKRYAINHLVEIRTTQCPLFLIKLMKENESPHCCKNSKWNNVKRIEEVVTYMNS